MSNVKEVSIAPVSAPVSEPTEAPVAETPAVEEQPTQPTEADNMASRFAALARREKEVRESQDQAKADQSKYQEYQDLKEQAKTNPLSVLERFGLNLDDIITQSLGVEEGPQSVEDQITALREEIANDKRSVEENAKAAEEAEEKALQDNIDAAIHKHKEGIETHLSDNKEKYELINLHGGQDLVWEVTEAHYEANNGEILTPEQASEQVEAYYEGQVRKAMQLSRFTSTPDTPSEPKIEAPVQASQTLTSEHTSPAGSKTTNLSPEESRAAAAALLQWS